MVDHADTRHVDDDGPLAVFGVDVRFNQRVADDLRAGEIEIAIDAHNDLLLQSVLSLGIIKKMALLKLQIDK